MIKADAQKDVTPVTFKVNDHDLRAHKRFLKFPVNLTEREEMGRLDRAQNDVTSHEQEIEAYRRAVRHESINAKAAQKRLDELKAKYPADTLFTEEAASTVVHELAKLPWIEHVYMSGPSVIVRTRPDVLKTIFDVGVVGFTTGAWELEFIEPKVLPLPQYELAINTEHMGGEPLANNSGKLAIRIMRKEDTSKFVPKNIWVQEIHPHWASNGGARFQNWEQLCLGDYEADVAGASKEGLIEFFNMLVAYLQTCGDEHAFRPKPIWAVQMGNPEYNHLFRMARPDETPDEVRAKYKADFKTHRQPTIKEGTAVNPGEGRADELADFDPQALMVAQTLVTGGTVVAPGRGFNRDRVDLTRIYDEFQQMNRILGENPL